MAKSIGQAIRSARVSRGLTQRALAKVVGLTVPQVANLEAGTPANPGWKTVVKFAKALGLSLDEVAGLRGSKPIPASIPRAVATALARAQKDAEKATESLGALARRIEDSD
jgi:transcriptional regulator with XRE-family HTH domain